MKRDTKIVMAVVAAIPIVILSLSTLCSWALAHGASLRWRLPFLLLCDGIPDRCFHLFGVTMPICARCTGIYVGLLAGLLAFWMLPVGTERAMRTAAFITVAPLAIDGLTQLARLRES